MKMLIVQKKPNKPKKRDGRLFSCLRKTNLHVGGCQPSFWSCCSHRWSCSSLAQRRESTSCTLREGGPSLGKPPRLVLEDEATAFPTPTSCFFGFLASPFSRNSKNRLTRFWPNEDREPSRRFWGTSNMVSSRLKHEKDAPLSDSVQEVKGAQRVINDTGGVFSFPFQIHSTADAADLTNRSASLGPNQSYHSGNRLQESLWCRYIMLNFKSIILQQTHTFKRINVGIDASDLTPYNQKHKSHADLTF